MNSQPSLLSISIEVHKQFLAPKLTGLLRLGDKLNVDQREALATIQQFAQAIADAKSGTAPRASASAALRKSKRIPKAQYGPHHGDLCQLCGKAHREHLPYPMSIGEPDQNAPRFADIQPEISPSYARYEEQSAALERCACGHTGERHVTDEMDNLLNCRDCDCRAFHYQQQEAA